MKDGGPAFPTHDGRGDGIGEDGMSLRDWLAGQAGQEAYRLLMDYYGQDWMGASLHDTINTLAATKVDIADAMLAAREPEPTTESTEET